MLINFEFYHFLVGIFLLLVLLPVVWSYNHDLSTLLFFSIFWFYLIALFRAVIFPIAINLDAPSTTFVPSINFIPFYFGPCFMPQLCVRGILDNIILTIPFGFGINFLLRLKPRNVFWLALTLGFVLEISQLVTSFLFRSTFHTVDINDLIFNTFGVLLGYGLFRAFVRVYLKFSWQMKINPPGLFAAIHSIAIKTEATDDL